MPKIIIVDDEEDQEDLITQRFAKKPFLKGYTFLFARNGKEAFKIISENKDIEIALLDINMPEMDGLTLVRKIKVINPALSAILISAYDDVKNLSTGLDVGAVDFVSKPVNFEILDSILKKLILSRQGIRLNEKNN